MSLKGRILRNAEGIPSRAIGTMADITEQRRRESELAEAKVLADQANKAKSEFLASMSHELRTPLNAIIGFSDVIRHGTFGEMAPVKYREYVDDIHNSGCHLLSLINDILDTAKIEAGKLELHPVSLEVAATVADALRMVQTQAAEAGLALDSRIEGELRLARRRTGAQADLRQSSVQRREVHHAGRARDGVRRAPAGWRAPRRRRHRDRHDARRRREGAGAVRPGRSYPSRSRAAARGWGFRSQRRSSKRTAPRSASSRCLAWARGSGANFRWALSCRFHFAPSGVVR